MKMKMDLGVILLATCMLGNFLLVVGRSTPRAVVETLLTDIDTAVPIYKHIGSIWEPVSPHKDFYILGQAVRTTVLRPPKDFQLIVGRSVNGSLAEPLDFDHPWTITPGKLIVWRMYCPFGYVSLGDIASKSKKPDVTKYRCVIKDATVPAIRGLVVHSDPNGDHVMRYIGLTAGWRSPFFLIEYLTSHIQTDFYSLRELYTAPTPMPGEETTINTETTTIETSTRVTGNETKNQNTNPQSNPPTTTILIIFGCLLGFVFILLLTWVAYICARKHKACGYTKGKETGDMALSSGDSARATNGTEYSYAADLHTSDLQDGDYSTIPQVPMDNNLEMRRNVLYEPSTDFQMVPNVIYNGNRPQLVIGPASNNSNEPLMNNSQDNIYAVAT
ncbi:uncharacterized protein LOC100176218 [Ciona intestinalis]